MALEDPSFLREAEPSFQVNQLWLFMKEIHKIEKEFKWLEEKVKKYVFEISGRSPTLEVENEFFSALLPYLSTKIDEKVKMLHELHSRLYATLK